VNTIRIYYRISESRQQHEKAATEIGIDASGTRSTK